ncbi:hypothetical protein H0H93_012114 [Arthromyces matolae]|nr:hypothetical protein H0H93_012114 [Arthromyces matolae]
MVHFSVPCYAQQQAEATAWDERRGKVVKPTTTRASSARASPTKVTRTRSTNQLTTTSSDTSGTPGADKSPGTTDASTVDGQEVAKTLQLILPNNTTGAKDKARVDTNILTLASHIVSIMSGLDALRTASTNEVHKALTEISSLRSISHGNASAIDSLKKELKELRDLQPLFDDSITPKPTYDFALDGRLDAILSQMGENVRELEKRMMDMQKAAGVEFKRLQGVEKSTSTMVQSLAGREKSLGVEMATLRGSMGNDAQLMDSIKKKAAEAQAKVVQLEKDMLLVRGTLARLEKEVLAGKTSGNPLVNPSPTARIAATAFPGMTASTTPTFAPEDGPVRPGTPALGGPASRMDFPGLYAMGTPASTNPTPPPNMFMTNKRPRLLSNGRRSLCTVAVRIKEVPSSSEGAVAAFKAVVKQTLNMRKQDIPTFDVSVIESVAGVLVVRFESVDVARQFVVAFNQGAVSKMMAPRAEVMINDGSFSSSEAEIEAVDRYLTGPSDFY